VWETFRDWHDANPKPLGCEICQLPGQLAMDHNHATGIPRGWLCRDCNLAMGYVGDSPFVIKRMLDYAIDHAANLDAESFAAANASGLYETFVVEPAREEWRKFVAEQLSRRNVPRP
jgi:hypothetical protein